MADSFDKLRALIQTRINQEKTPQPEAAGLDHARLLGSFVEASLKAQHITLKEFAKRLDIEVELADAILKGSVPASELDDGLLADLAAATGHPFNTIRLLMGKPITPTLSVSRNAAAGAGSATSTTNRRPSVRRGRP
jgi:transcriptional regulator with XRE-family HTH domain